jgi:hypothetical protein
MAKDSPKERIRITTDRWSATITFLPDSGKAGSIALSAERLLLLIQQLGEAHATIVGQNIPQFEHKKVDHVLNTRWYIETEVLGGASGLSFYHNKFGPVGFLLPIHEAERLVNILARQVARAKREGRGEIDQE